MDVTQDIKSRLPIEELVARYCQLQKKGRNFVALCPFHKDTHPSFLVSPDKGIAYCFACQSGGDVFSFYQKIEGVDFRQALRDLGELTGVKVEESKPETVKKDQKDRLRECLEEAVRFYRDQLAASTLAKNYLRDRHVPQEQIEKFGLGYAPDSFSATYEHLLKRGFSRREILDAGMGVQKDLKEERIYDRFRHRLMFPIHDHQGAIVAFGGRTLGEDDAKYINSAEGILYHKSNVLFGMHHAREAIRNTKNVFVVEGYFDLLACHQVGIENVVATSGTALTEQHVKILKRSAGTVSLCLDADRAGQDAAERAFLLLAKEGVLVRSIRLPRKDASELLHEDSALLRSTLEGGGLPYLDRVLEQLREQNLADPGVRRTSLMRLIALLQALPFAVERKDYTAKAAAVFQTTESALEEDLLVIASRESAPVRVAAPSSEAEASGPTFSKMEIALVLFFLYPKLRATLLSELIAPEGGFAEAYYRALQSAPDAAVLTVDDLPIDPEHRERAGILALFGEEHGFTDWSESLAVHEIRRNCLSANREMLHAKQEELVRRLRAVQGVQNATEESLLKTQFEQLTKLMRKVG